MTVTGGGIAANLPYNVGIFAEYLTDLSSNPMQRFDVGAAKKFRMMKISAGFTKDFSLTEGNFGYYVSLELMFSMYSQYGKVVRDVVIVDKTQWDDYEKWKRYGKR